MEYVTIIGSGPAGFTAAIYAARANLKPLLLEGFQAGGTPGGQLMTTTEVENYPGFPHPGISGPKLMEMFRRQAQDYGTRTFSEDVVDVDLKSRPFRVRTEEREVETHAVIIATGALAKRLGVPSEERLWTRGISACAVCDGALPLFRGKDLVVVGGGDTAVEEATYLTKFSPKVYIVHRRDTLRASSIMQERALKHAKIEMVWDTILEDAEGSDRVTGARLKDVKTGAVRSLPAGGIFYAIGHEPNSKFLNGQVETDETGYIKVKPNRTLTSVEGVFACGDVVDRVYRQAVTAAGTGCMAALDAERWLAEKGID
ncbi:MAG TPA: thioredoxin-disulfide reductase [Planctomycetota bacterium]|nr:thioredoxin-disulfide reductase [Planctomycetota bacterium]